MMAFRLRCFSDVAASRKARTDQTSVTTSTRTIVPSEVRSDNTGLRRMFFRTSRANFMGDSKHEARNSKTETNSKQEIPKFQTILWPGILNREFGFLSHFGFEI